MIPIEKEEDLFWSLVFLLVRLDLSWTIQWKVLSTWEHWVFNDDLGPMHIYIIGVPVGEWTDIIPSTSKQVHQAYEDRPTKGNYFSELEAGQMKRTRMLMWNVCISTVALQWATSMAWGILPCFLKSIGKKPLGVFRVDEKEWLLYSLTATASVKKKHC